MVGVSLKIFFMLSYIIGTSATKKVLLASGLQTLYYRRGKRWGQTSGIYHRICSQKPARERAANFIL